MRPLNSNPNVDNSDLINYPGGRIKDNNGTSNGTGVNEQVYGDLHQTVAKLMRLYSITPNGFPDNETNKFQIIDALRALASKNDFVLPLGVSSGVIQVEVKVGSMLENEQIVCKASFNYGSETQIKGSDNVTLTATVQGSFKTNEYVRLIKTASGATLVRLSDNASLDSMVGGFSYLKKASQAEENAGAIETAATTPLTNKTAFGLRVNNDTASAPYLATASRNGLYPKEHFEIVANFSKRLKAVGGFSPFDVGSALIGSTISPFGDVLSATYMPASPGYSIVRVVLKPTNVMDNLDYKVIESIESLGNKGVDSSIFKPTFSIVSESTFDMTFLELTGSGVQTLKVHLDLIQL